MRKLQKNKRDVYEWFEGNKFESAIQYAIKHRNIVGVEKCLSELQANYQNYSAQIDKLIKEESPTLDKMFTTWNMTEKIKDVCKWGCISCLILFIMGLIAQFSDPLLIIIFLIFILGGIGAIIFKIVSIVFRYSYNRYFESVMDKERAINAQYIKDVYALEEEVDTLYLTSLEPSHREVVLMRRDQERQHQERMRIEQERLNSQKAMEEEQKKTRQVQEELLYIEQERERRYWKNRY